MFELAEDVVLAGAAVTSAALPSEAEDVLVATDADAAVDEALVLAEAAVEELEVELPQCEVTGVMSTVWHAVSLHMMSISAFVGVLSEDGEYPESLAHDVTSSDVSRAVTEAVSHVAACATEAVMVAAISADAKTFMLGCYEYLCAGGRLENDSRPSVVFATVTSSSPRMLRSTPGGSVDELVSTTGAAVVVAGDNVAAVAAGLLKVLLAVVAVHVLLLLWGLELLWWGWALSWSVLSLWASGL
ncbi:uncharacterized protein IUM83_16342 [Phytophthora cinnamomi]|uniref:uncharacterized protein n=1 Tax=Phytophthora cinnamomi TaxID=4785 RepID=UPI003559B7D5|nr:hypothetical protein IUM83_16342 [Phytophthora cinnamomi]